MYKPNNKPTNAQISADGLVERIKERGEYAVLTADDIRYLQNKPIPGTTHRFLLDLGTPKNGLVVLNAAYLVLEEIQNGNGNGNGS